MSRRPEGLNLDDGLMVRKGEARGVDPSAVLRPKPEPASVEQEDHPAPPQLESVAPRQQPLLENPPIVIGKRQTIERVFTNVRIPIELDERLYRMIVETRRTKQDIIEGFIRAGLDSHESGRRGVG